MTQNNVNVSSTNSSHPRTVIHKKINLNICITLSLFCPWSVALNCYYLSTTYTPFLVGNTNCWFRYMSTVKINKNTTFLGMPSNVDVTSHCAANDRVRTLSLTTAQTMSWKTDCGNARSLTLAVTAHCYRSPVHGRGIYTGKTKQWRTMM